MSRTDQPPATSPSARALIGIIEACYPTDIIHTAVNYYSDGPAEMTITVEGVGGVSVPASPVPDPPHQPALGGDGYHRHRGAQDRLP